MTDEIVKRGRGRPKGSKNKVKTVEVKEKRPRGRPKKTPTEPKKRRNRTQSVVWDNLFTIPKSEFARMMREAGASPDYKLEDTGDELLMNYQDANHDDDVAVARKLFSTTHRVYHMVVDGKMVIHVEKTKNS